MTLIQTDRLNIDEAIEAEIPEIIEIESHPENRDYLWIGTPEEHRDGILRQNYLAERGYLDQIIYSLLRSEYAGWIEKFGD